MKSYCSQYFTSLWEEQVLYSKDVLSDQAIIYWHGKGSRAEARAHFLKAADPLVAFLKDQEESEEESKEEGTSRVSIGEASPTNIGTGGEEGRRWEGAEAEKAREVE